jgi:hypothetical protein
MQIKYAQLCLVVAVIGVAAALNSLILLSPNETSKNFFANTIRPGLAAGAMTLGVFVMMRQKLSGKFGRAYAGIAIGLVLYFIAESVMAYYTLGLGIEVPFPSLADAFRFAAYVPFAYGLFTLSSLYRKRNRRKHLVIFTLIGAALCGYYMHALIGASDPTRHNALPILGITLAYPILDTVLIIPALLAVLSTGKGYLTAVPWIFISCIFAVIADTSFGFTATMHQSAAYSTWNLFYNAEYLTMAAGMFWYSTYMIFDSRRFTNLGAAPPATKEQKRSDSGRAGKL